MQEAVEIYGAKEHNLKDISLSLPRNRLITITGVSGSGKSSLAFDTLYAEGRYRYMQSFSAYARTFMGELKRPDVEKITGLTPVISIEQRTTHTNPRSTVGTLTEVYDFLRVLYAKVADAYSYLTNEPMIKRSVEEIIAQVLRQFSGDNIAILAPLVRDRKGHYRELFERMAKKGFSKVRVDGMLQQVKYGMQLERYKQHSVEILIDSFSLEEATYERCKEGVQLALQEGEGMLMVLKAGEQTPYYFSKHLTDPTSGLSYEEPSPAHFSFNAKAGACGHCKGLGVVNEINLQSVIPDPSLSIAAGGITVIGKYRKVFYFDKITDILKPHSISLYTPIQEIPPHIMQKVLYGRLPKDANERTAAIQALGGDYHVKYSDLIEKLGVMGMVSYAFVAQHTSFMRKLIEEHTTPKPCPVCHGKRLKPASLGFRIDGKDIIAVTQLSLDDFASWLDDLNKKLVGRKKKIAGEILKEIRVRTQLLNDLGLHYLSLDRPLKTLSGGESQRLRLATQIGSELVDVMYILDEPSIGLHPRDNNKLIASLKKLRDLGNTVVVVEHDKEMMLNSDHIVDIGIGAGKHGGEVVFSGCVDDLMKSKGSTAAYLSGKQCIDIPQKRRQGHGCWLTLKGASGHNLKNVDFSLPLGTLTVMTGVSGSGKSTLLMETLVALLRRRYHRSHKMPMPFESIEGAEHINKVIKIDQSPIGRTPRSNPATYTGVFADIRNFYSMLPESKVRGYKMGQFSFNVKGGRCPDCEGRGIKVMEMGLLPDIALSCERCMGRRFSVQTLEVRYKGCSIADVLDMPVEKALDFFSDYPSIRNKLQAIDRVGLGYVTLGQHATTLSGGEAQRMKLAAELLKKDTGRTLYVLDEPTTGLHFEDIKKLLDILYHLVDKGNTAVVIEHNIEVIKVADYLIDMGPEGGEAGGYIVATGTPEALISHNKGAIVPYLMEALSV